jgi:hypothetical protein
MAQPTPTPPNPCSRDNQTDRLIVECLEQAKAIQKIHPEMFTSAEKVAWLQKQYSELSKKHVDLLYHASHLQWQAVQLARENSYRG